jgi:hypothetical protein
MKPNKEQMKARAYGIAESHFYCDDDDCQTAWEPFEDWSHEDIQEQVHNLAQIIFESMLWAQGDPDE